MLFRSRAVDVGSARRRQEQVVTDGPGERSASGSPGVDNSGSADIGRSASLPGTSSHVDGFAVQPDAAAPLDSSISSDHDVLTSDVMATEGAAPTHRALAAIKSSLVSDDPLTRRMTAAALVNSFGNGLLATTTAIYFTRFVNIANHALALTYTATAVLTLLIAVPIGHIVDKVRPRKFAVGAISALGVLSLTNAFVVNLPQFVAVQMVLTLAEVAMRVNQQTYIGRLRQGAARVTMMSYQRAVMNLGLGLGSAVSGIALTINHANAFRVLFALDALTWFGNAAIRRTLPDLEPIGQHAKQGRAKALRDKLWVSIACVNGLTEIHNVVLTLAVPLWIDQFTDAPHWVVAGTFLMNTAMVAALQVRFGKGTHEPLRAARVHMHSLWWVAGACIVYPFAHLLHSGWLAAVVLLAGAAIHTIGELLKSAGSWGIQYGLVPQEYQGQYQSVWMMGRQISDFVGPPLVTALCLGWKVPGWIALAIIFLALSALMPPLVARAVAARQVGTADASTDVSLEPGQS